MPLEIFPLYCRSCRKPFPPAQLSAAGYCAECASRIAPAPARAPRGSWWLLGAAAGVAAAGVWLGTRGRVAAPAFRPAPASRAPRAAPPPQALAPRSRPAPPITGTPLTPAQPAAAPPRGTTLTAPQPSAPRAPRPPLVGGVFREEKYGERTPRLTIYNADPPAIHLRFVGPNTREIDVQPGQTASFLFSPGDYWFELSDGVHPKRRGRGLFCEYRHYSVAFEVREVPQGHSADEPLNIGEYTQPGGEPRRASPPRRR